MPVTHGVTGSSPVRTAQKYNSQNKHFGALVQLVRIHACHAWGHGFESRTHREAAHLSGFFCFMPKMSGKMRGNREKSLYLHLAYMVNEE